MKLKKERIPVLIGIIIAFLFLIYLIFCFFVSGKDFISNTTINNINVGNLTKEEAIEKLEKQYEKDKDQLLLSLSLNDKTYQIDIKDEVISNIKNDVTNIAKKDDNFFMRGYNYIFNRQEYTSLSIKDKKSVNQKIKDSQILDYNTLVPTTYEVKKDKVIFTKGKSGEVVKLKNVYNCIEKALNTYQFKRTLKIEPTEISEDEQCMNDIYKHLSKEAQNATLDKNNNYAIVAEQFGAKYDNEKAIELFNKTAEGKTFEISAEAILPEITKEMLEKNLFKDVLGEYSTYVSGTAVRKNNVKLAGEKCSGVILLPGEEFSYNKVVGKRTKAAGFGEAGAYLNGETVQEVGGGVCQASSTIYNAIVLSNLEITERHNHTFISSYVPIGRDATVSWGGPDFKFKNNQKYPIKLIVSYSNSQLYAKVLGTNVDGIRVEFTSTRTATTGYNTKYETDPNLPEGTEQIKSKGSGGAKAVSYRKIYDKNGKLISSKKEANSSYKGHDEVIVRGTKKVETPVTPTVPTTPTTPTEPTTPDEGEITPEV